ncbi:AbrB/MazE/SpoVT family DNA-binding domain-containing protein [Bacillus sp. FJAT-42376]|uniref:AbrB/MazE/SpoVT family DNA-binding domain-containing protein n=1 Tax=Bacillus sp. FJAT-42376 TaxID=2014076 RepID=UPI000F502F78|nr:AbrB/MazE/SpoVT family DNA-binding domain-containing protein [Bacillus sp. FJAT-42376]AZB41628.1 AbrB/MazE/SpoVT family DNA-binding domain-containing protein [Bacillus sp. FJAT-42376]
MEFSKLSSKGQITIPKHVRETLDLHEGERVAFIEEDGLVIMTKADLESLHKVQDIVSDEKFKQLMRKAKTQLEE